MGSRFEHTTGAGLIALVAGVVSSVIGYFIFLSVFTHPGIMEFVFPGPQPKPALWMLPSLIKNSIVSGVVFGAVVSCLVFWILDKRVYRAKLTL
jgi:hypothetical protein